MTVEDWGAGPAHVANRIREVRAAWEQNRASQSDVVPEGMANANVIQLFDRAPLVQASMANLSASVLLKTNVFDRMQRPNEEIAFLSSLNALPKTAQRISDIVTKGRDEAGAETALALEVGRLRGEVERLRSDLKAAIADIEVLRQKPWYKSASVLWMGGTLGAVISGLWLLSADDNRIEERWNNLATDFDFLTKKIWPELEDNEAEPLRLELSLIHI